MDVLSKLRLIQEGYAIADINSGKANAYSNINESTGHEEFAIISDIFSDIHHFNDITESLLSESEVSTRSDVFTRLIEWIIEKIKQFKEFIKRLFQARRAELKTNQLRRKLLDIETQPLTINYALSGIIENPNKSINELKYLINRFEELLAAKIAIEHGGINKDIKENTKVLDLKIATWKQVTIRAHIAYDDKVSTNVIDHYLKKTRVITINTKQQIENIISFGYQFYDLWVELDKTLSYYEGQLRKLQEFTDIGYKTITLICETIIQTFNEIVSYIDGHIRKLYMIDNYNL